MFKRAVENLQDSGTEPVNTAPEALSCAARANRIEGLSSEKDYGFEPSQHQEPSLGEVPQVSSERFTWTEKHTSPQNSSELVLQPVQLEAIMISSPPSRATKSRRGRPHGCLVDAPVDPIEHSTGR